MPRSNKPGQVEWSAIRQDVLRDCLADIASQGAKGFLTRVAHRYEAHGVTENKLHLWLRTIPHWKTQRAEAELAYRTHSPAPEPEPAPPMDPVEQERQRQEHLRTLKQQRDLLQAVAGEHSLRAYLEQLAVKTAPALPAPPKYRPPSSSASATRESILMQWSDWHAYEVVKAERTRGFNAYDSVTFGARVRSLVETHLSIKRRMERGKGWVFPHCYLALNGDMVSGTIHEAERHSDAPNIVMAVYGCAHVLASAIRDVAGDYETVTCYGTTGNHGRFPDARRMQQKDPLRSWDAMIYILAREMLRNCPNVTLHLPDAYSVAFDVEGFTFLQTHGHDIKSWNSIPHYGINRYVGNINALEASRQKKISYFLFGHFHEESSLRHAAGESFINGSLIGGTEYGINALGRSAPPCQWMLGVHPEHGVTHRWPLRPDDTAEGYEVMPWASEAA